MTLPDPPTYPIDERESGTYSATIVGNDGVTPLPGSTLSTLTLTLYVIKQDGTEEVVNGRNQQNVLNANNVTVSEAGALVWSVRPLDTIIVESFLPVERHIALFEWTWPTGNAGKHEFVAAVRNLRRVS